MKGISKEHQLDSLAGHNMAQKWGVQNRAYYAKRAAKSIKKKEK